MIRKQTNRQPSVTDRDDKNVYPTGTKGSKSPRGGRTINPKSVPATMPKSEYC